MVGAVLGEVQVSLCVVGAVLGEVQVSLFVVGAVLGEIWKDSRSAKCCIFQYKPFVRSAKSNYGCVAGCGLTETVSVSVSDRPRIGNDVAAVFRKFLPDVGWSFCVAGAVFGEFEDQACESFCVAGAVLGEGQVSLFVVGAVLGEVQVSLFVVGAILGEVQVSLFVVGAVLGEIWKDSRSAKCCIFQYKPFVRSVKSNLGGVAGCGLTETVSDHRNGLGTVSDRPRIGNDV